MEIHRRLIDRFGGTHGTRDLGLLESALHRPQTGYYESLPHMAAALLESLYINHAFLDGNKRLAYFVTDVFLRLNGFKFVVDEKKAHKFLIDYFSEGPRTLVELRHWIEKSISKL